MRAFTVVDAVVAPMRADDIDTDRIVPARFLRKPRKDGYQDFLFYDDRFDAEGVEKPDFILNRPPYRDAGIILAGRNFACGSSREGAVYALADFGIRSVIAPSFSDIFFNNALVNGLLPVQLPPQQTDEIFDWLEEQGHACSIRVDLVSRQVHAGGRLYPFKLNGLKRRCMLEGLDEISLTRTHAARIEAFERRYRQERPWLS